MLQESDQINTLLCYLSVKIIAYPKKWKCSPLKTKEAE